MLISLPNAPLITLGTRRDCGDGEAQALSPFPQKSRFYGRCCLSSVCLSVCYPSDGLPSQTSGMEEDGVCRTKAPLEVNDEHCLGKLRPTIHTWRTNPLCVLAVGAHPLLPNCGHCSPECGRKGQTEPSGAQWINWTLSTQKGRPWV